MPGEPQQKCIDAKLACPNCNGFGFRYQLEGVIVTQITCSACKGLGRRLETLSPGYSSTFAPSDLNPT